MEIRYLPYFYFVMTLNEITEKIKFVDYCEGILIVVIYKYFEKIMLIV